MYTLADMPKDLGFFQKRQWLLNHGQGFAHIKTEKNGNFNVQLKEIR